MHTKDSVACVRIAPEILETNFHGVVLATRAFAPALLAGEVC